MEENHSEQEKQAEEKDLLKTAFKVRKRQRKPSSKRRKESATEEKTTDEPKLSELRLLKEAQQLRERNRERMRDDRSKAEEKSSKDENNDGTENGTNEVLGGLSNNFAVESSTHAFEASLEKYIKEGIKQKFGEDNDEESKQDKQKDKSQVDLYQIPGWLRLEERPMYDPSENMPAAGAEEVELPLESRLENQRKTIEAHQKLLKTRAKGESDRSPTLNTTGNLSSNFEQHRRQQLDKKEQSNRSSSQQNANLSGFTDQNKRKRQQTATDALAVDRYRKRWRP